MFFTIIWMLASLVMPTFAVLPKSHFNIDEAKTRCISTSTGLDPIYMSDFSWGYTLDELSDKFEEIYASGKRLNHRAYYDEAEDQFYLFFGYNDDEMIPVKINPEFIQSVTRQIEIAIALDFADYVFFPDMGHAHLYFEQNHWQKNYSTINKSYSNQHILYEKMFADPKMKPLYHLTEQLQMLDENKQVIDDKIISFKYWHRNFLGSNDTTDNFQVPIADPNKHMNTVSGIDGHQMWSAGFAVSASKDGCFPYRDQFGKTRYFDISINDPAYPPSSGSDWEY